MQAGVPQRVAEGGDRRVEAPTVHPALCRHRPQCGADEARGQRLAGAQRQHGEQVAGEVRQRHGAAVDAQLDGAQEAHLDADRDVPVRSPHPGHGHARPRLPISPA